MGKTVKCTKKTTENSGVRKYFYKLANYQQKLALFGSF